MTLVPQVAHLAAPPGMADDDVLATLMAWQQSGRRTALVTLVGIDGTTPRPLGAQMAVADDGGYSGYLSGGCFETTVALEAAAVIASRQNRLVRYGKGSAYLDLQLPCGSGLDLYFDQALSRPLLDEASARRSRREPFSLVIDLVSGMSEITAMASTDRLVAQRLGNCFVRPYLPQTRILVVGAGPYIVAIAGLMAAAGLELEVVTPDDAVRAELSSRFIPVRGLTDARHFVAGLDAWTAAVVAFHEHEWEVPVLEKLLAAPCFYIGVMGSRAAHDNRVKGLAERGVPEDQIARLRSPIGSIPGSKSRATLAAGVLAEVVRAAKDRGFLA